jgi:hypothetical protein
VGLTAVQKAIWQKARSLGSGGQAVALRDDACSYLIARIVSDLDLGKEFPEFPSVVPSFFTSGDSSALVLAELDSKALFERLVAAVPDADTYFACLAALHKARLKYERILSTQPIATLEQVGPRGLLQYGKVSAAALNAFLFWRKWFYDIDNRAGQETGYLFEPIIAYAIGGTPAPAKKSPVKRHGNRQSGRQVDCLLDDFAYEIKIRVTIAASGQGRWQQELDFPLDCRTSGYTPVLLCMDPTPNEKLGQLVKIFQEQEGHVYIGDAAWKHLDDLAGVTMSKFLDKYVREPIQDLLANVSDSLQDFSARWGKRSVQIEIAGELLNIEREANGGEVPDDHVMPDDADDEFVGP